MMNPSMSTSTAAAAVTGHTNCETSSTAQGRAAAGIRGFAAAAGGPRSSSCRSVRRGSDFHYCLRLLVCIWMVLCLFQHIEAKTTTSKKKTTPSTHFAKTTKKTEKAPPTKAPSKAPTKAPPIPPASSYGSGKVYNVRAFGANGNGVSSDSPVRKLMCLHCSTFNYGIQGCCSDWISISSYIDTVEFSWWSTHVVLWNFLESRRAVLREEFSKKDILSQICTLFWIFAGIFECVGSRLSFHRNSNHPCPCGIHISSGVSHGLLRSWLFRHTHSRG